MKLGVFASGCFWCTEAVFKRLKGVSNVKSGYTGGFIKNPPYREVCQGITGHAEGISFNFNESLISYVDLLEVFFATHDPTTLNRQANDVGTQYRSAIFYTNDNQYKIASKYIMSLEKAKIFKNTIVIYRMIIRQDLIFLKMILKVQSSIIKKLLKYTW